MGGSLHRDLYIYGFNSHLCLLFFVKNRQKQTIFFVELFLHIVDIKIIECVIICINISDKEKSS